MNQNIKFLKFFPHFNFNLNIVYLILKMKFNRFDRFIYTQGPEAETR